MSKKNTAVPGRIAGFLGECDTFAGGKKSAHSVGLLNNNQSVNW